MLEIKNLTVSIEGKKIIKNLSLNIKKGEVHAIMGPNGSGKSTLANTLAGNENCQLEEGYIKFEKQNLAELDVAQRAHAGIFMAFQYPIEIPGVPVMIFLKEMLNCVRKARGQDEIKTPDLIKKIQQQAKEMNVDFATLKRELNVGFSGGEKKRFEILQMRLLEPKLAILDETDSGLDIDAIKIVADGVNRFKSEQRGFLIITHYQRLLEYIIPDKVHVLAKGTIQQSGGKELALKLEEEGYEAYA